MKAKWGELITCVGITLAAGAVGAAATAGAIDSWYTNLNKPFFTPPNWVFGPVWTLLYLMMGTAWYLIRISPAPKNNPHRAEKLFGVQLLLNVLWSVIFFGLHNPLAALLEIVILETAVLFTWQKFREISRSAALMLVPYGIWVAFAAGLNLAIVIMN